MRRLSGLIFAALSTICLGQQPAEITFLHINDTHAHIEPTLIQRKPYGGLARVATLVQRFRASDPNPIFVHAGDVFQGTLYFNVYEGLADLALLNAMNLQVLAAGNHEFDKGPGPFAAFINSAKFPVIAANLDVDAEPSLKGKILPSTIVNVGPHRVGFVGAIVDNLATIASPGPTVKVKPMVESVQAAVDDLTRRGINKIVLLSHVGFDVDRELVGQLRDVDLVIGGHSHTLMGNFNVPGFPTPRQTYPTQVTDAAGRTVPIFQAWEWGKVFGRFKAEFDAEGRLLRIKDAQPIVVDESIPEDVTAKSMIEAFRRPLAQLAETLVGETTAAFARESLPGGERPIANVIADGMLAATAKQGAQVAFINSGGVRAGLPQGKVTYGDAISVQPFNNTLVLVEVTGTELIQALEHGVGRGGFLFPSKGFVVTIDRTKPEGQRVSATLDGRAVEPGTIYTVVVPNFIAGGGDGHTVFRDAMRRKVDTGMLDIDAFIEFIKANSPLTPKAEGRIQGGN
jgi:5'-nucleotidase